MLLIMDILGDLLLAAVPLAVLICFIVFLVQFIKCPKEDTERRKKYKTVTIVLGIILGVIVFAFLALMLLLAAAVMYM